MPSNETRPMGIDNATKPMGMNDNSTQPMDMQRDNNRIYLNNDVTIDGKNDKYEIKASDYIDSGGESHIYKATRLSDNLEVAVKIYDAFADNKESRNYRKKTIAFLEANKDYKKTHIMPLWDDGFIDLEDRDGDHYKRPFDIIPLCKKGSLTKSMICDYNILKNKVVPEVLTAINILHSSNLVHRDIKPSNIYMYDDVVLLADFGTTSDVIDQKAHGNTSTRRQTAGYSAPEISESFYVVASDYYSLGCMIATLYNKGRHVYQDLLDQRKENDVRRAMRLEGLPLDCPPNESDLQVLVDALTMGDSKIRAGYDAVKLWCKDSDAFVASWKSKTVQGFEKPPLNFIFENIKCNTYEELTTAILNNWEKGKDYLYRDLIAGKLKTYDQTLSNNIHDIIDNREISQNRDLALAICLHYINTTTESACPIFWCGTQYESLSDIATAINKGKADENKIIEMLKSGFLSWKHEKTEGISRETINSIKEIEGITRNHPKIGYFVFMYKNEPDLKKNMPSADTYFKEITRDNKKWYDTALNILNDDKTFAHLMCIKKAESALKDIKENLSGNFVANNPNSNLTKLYMLFDNICDDKTYVREHYLKYAPQAYLYWFKENLNLYSFNSSKAKDFEKRIKDIKVNKEMSVNEITTALSSLWTAFSDCEFFNLFQNNYLLTYLGFRTDKEKDGITTNNSYAFFAGDFFGIQVPIGYLKTNGIEEK